MCSHYQPVLDGPRHRQFFGADLPAGLDRADVWPLYPASLVRRSPEAEAGDETVPRREALAGQFGLVPHWAQDAAFGRRTYNARSETAASKPSFRDAWRHGQRCIIPAEAFFEPDWRSGKAVPTRFTQADGQPMGIAGLWSCWQAPTGERLHSFAMLTINANQHALMKHYHRPAEEKRMLVVLPPPAYDDWLTAPVAQTLDFLQPWPAEQLQASAAAAGPAGR